MEKNQEEPQEPNEDEKPVEDEEKPKKEEEKQPEKKERKSFGRIKRRPKIVISVREPRRKSSYDVLMDNLKVAGRKTFLHRIVYGGIHNFPIENHKFDAINPITNFFKSIIHKTNNANYCFEKLTGFLMYYDCHFIHVVEGDEDALGIHLQFIYEPDSRKNFENLKLFSILNHINDRLTSDWSFYYGIPRQCVTTLDTHASLRDIASVLYVCILKVFKLIMEIASQRIGSNPDVLVDPSTYKLLEREKEKEKDRASQESNPVRVRSSIQSLNPTRIVLNPLKGFLPEIEQLDFLLECDFPPNLEEYKMAYGVFVIKKSYKENVWPIPSDFIPYDVFDTQYQLVMEFPKSEQLENSLSADKMLETEKQKDEKNY
ncbi:unnamed protein product [Psylliodes chrysocephalus]|uniref:Uncharacterized protein n=1 Tax=Psylliodes chrysocephalus TaxID=3402493 RepID=A0A9P0D1T3_9CUCU|nr:unnamed protein product [Psylliodes chrysocephala]